MQEIRETGKLEPATEEKLKAVLGSFTERFLSERPEE